MDDVKVIDWICTGSKQIWQSEAIKYLRETRKTNNVAQRRRTTNVARRRRNHKIKRNRCENHLFQQKGNRKSLISRRSCCRR
ncbi:hypothetical protein MTR_2g090665 [Medicago truncatula]|uniref:Uncharacterized protein n=1 Tax=Medicago truncatula TaxID=3880 RepID=A0A072VM02_MEDTR|nr:hypothetical protein MTR_2g090665 [Medicago truncatula]